MKSLKYLKLLLKSLKPLKLLRMSLKPINLLRMSLKHINLLRMSLKPLKLLMKSKPKLKLNLKLNHSLKGIVALKKFPKLIKKMIKKLKIQILKAKVYYQASQISLNLISKQVSIIKLKSVTQLQLKILNQQKLINQLTNLFNNLRIKIITFNLKAQKFNKRKKKLIQTKSNRIKNFNITKSKLTNNKIVFQEFKNSNKLFKYLNL